MRPAYAIGDAMIKFVKRRKTNLTFFIVTNLGGCYKARISRFSMYVVIGRWHGTDNPCPLVGLFLTVPGGRRWGMMNGATSRPLSYNMG